MDSTVDALVGKVRARVATTTLIQDVSDPLTGDIDRRKIAGKITNVEQAVGELASAVEVLDAKVQSFTL